MSQPEEPRKWERHEKGEKGEKERGEKHGEKHSDPLSNIVWAAIFIWAGVVLLLDNLGIVTGIVIDGQTLEPWSLIFIGAGVIVLLEVVLRLIMPSYRRPIVGSVIFAGFLLAAGLSAWLSWELVWPVILILVGVVILLSTAVRR